MLYRIRSGSLAVVVPGDDELAAARKAVALFPSVDLGELVEITPLPEGEFDALYVATATVVGKAVTA